MKPNIDTFGPGVRRLNPQLFHQHPDLKPCEIRPVDPTVKESLSVQLSRNPLQLESRDEIKSERQLQGQIASLLRMRGIVFQRSRMDKATTGTVGFPDFVFSVLRQESAVGEFGRPCAFEVKMPGGKLSEEQKRCIDSMELNGWDVRIIHSVDEALLALNAMGARELE